MNKNFLNVISGLVMFLLVTQVANATITITSGPYIFNDDPVTREVTFGKINDSIGNTIEREDGSAKALEQNQDSQNIVSGKYSSSIKEDHSSTELEVIETLANGSTSRFLATVTPTLQQENYPLSDYPCAYDFNFKEDGTDFSINAIVDVCRNLLPRGVKIVGTSSLDSFSSSETEALREIIKKLKDKAADFRIILPNPEKTGFIQQQPYYGGQFYLAHTQQILCNGACALAISAGIVCALPLGQGACVTAAIAAGICFLCYPPPIGYNDMLWPTKNFRTNLMERRRSSVNTFTVRQL